jgi:hypothetical protein
LSDSQPWRKAWLTIVARLLRPSFSKARALSKGSRFAPKTLVATLASLMSASSSTFLNAIGCRRPLLDQPRPLPRQIAQFADWRGRHETGLQQTVPQQLGDPLAVLHVGLAVGHSLDVLGIDQNDVNPALEDVEDRLSVHAGRYPWRRA